MIRSGQFLSRRNVAYYLRNRSRMASVPKAVVKRIMREIVSELGSCCTRFQPKAIDTLLEEMEVFVIDFLKRAGWAMRHVGRKTLKVEDLRLVQTIRKIPSKICSGTNMYPSN